MNKCGCACECKRKDEYTEEGFTCEFCFREHTFDGEDDTIYPMNREQIGELANV